MIRPPGWEGVLFSQASDGDLRNDLDARKSFVEAAGAPSSWATARQVHGADVVRVDRPGDAGEADALWTVEPALGVAVFTADCFPVVVQAKGAVGVAHAGWRGTAAGVVAGLVDEMGRSGHPPVRAAVGPGIGPCCFEVGAEVSERFPRATSTTTWSTDSVDLRAAVADQLDGIEVWAHGGCTFHDDGWFSHRRDKTPKRLVALGWLP